jgi:hypothetical protein
MVLSAGLVYYADKSMEKNDVFDLGSIPLALDSGFITQQGPLTIDQFCGRQVTIATWPL